MQSPSSGSTANAMIRRVGRPILPPSSPIAAALTLAIILDPRSDASQLVIKPMARAKCEPVGLPQRDVADDGLSATLIGRCCEGRARHALLDQPQETLRVDGRRQPPNLVLPAGRHWSYGVMRRRAV